MEAPSSPDGDTAASARALGRARPRFLRAALRGRSALQRADQFLARSGPKDRPGLAIFIVHCVFADRGEAESGVLDPHERATPEALERLVEYYRSHGYRFVSLDEIDAGLAPGGLYAHLTFDDGFANNLRLIDLLAELEAPASVYPAIDLVRSGRVFWWNALYRERAKRGQLSRLPAETDLLLSMTEDGIYAYLREQFGPDALEPAGDVDRPLSVPELRQLAASPWIEIGNHTLGHAILRNYRPTVAAEQIAGAQRWLEGELGEAPIAIAYPNGVFDDAIVAIARNQGLRLGVTTMSGLNRLPSDASRRMRLKRFRVVFDDRAEQRMLAVRGRLQLTAAARQVVLKNR